MLLDKVIQLIEIFERNLLNVTQHMKTALFKSEKLFKLFDNETAQLLG